VVRLHGDWPRAAHPYPARPSDPSELLPMQTDSNVAASSGGRIAVLDVLRAFALFGIIVTHSAGGFLAGRPPGPNFMSFGRVDEIFAQLNSLFVFGKFFTIFSFLFGLSFAIQMRSAERKGGSFSGRFVWRLAVLALIALVHGLFFTGDILIIYAALGLLLIAFRNVGTKTLVVLGLLLVFNVPGMMMALFPSPPPPPEVMKLGMQSAMQQFEAKQLGGFRELFSVTYGAGFRDKMMFQLFTGRLWITFGLFLLGLAAGRAQIFNGSDENQAFMTKLLIGAGVVALATTVILVLNSAGFAPPILPPAMAGFLQTAQQATLSAFYVAAVALIYWRDPVHGLLSKLAPVGKMGLTVYLTQTVFGLALFYGIGLGMLGKMGVAAATGWGAAFYVVQIILARAWMRRFAMGPVEWVWRSLTYLRPQPLRLAPEARGSMQAA
jgi:uncharacterized protein